MIDHKFVLSLLTIASLFSVSGYSQPAAEQDWLVVPGARVGAISAESSDLSLEALFGLDDVQRIDVNLGEGFYAPGTVVYPDDASRRIEVVWTDDSRTTPMAVRLTGDSSVWQTAEDISLGSTLLDIERLNGFPFKLAGFAFDYAGTITYCGRGLLTMLGCSGGDDIEHGQKNRLVIIRLRPNAGSTGSPEYRQVQGDRTFSSGHPAMQALNPKVYQMIVLIGPSSGE